MGFVIQLVSDKAEEGPHTGLYSGFSTTRSPHQLGAKTAIEGCAAVP
jgi:hypothetical protein